MSSTIRHYLNIVEQLQVSEDKTAPTIEDATDKAGINRKTSDRITDPKGWFHSKWPTNGKKKGYP
jgi:hypothetical protein